MTILIQVFNLDTEESAEITLSKDGAQSVKAVLSASCDLDAPCALYECIDSVLP